MAYKVFTNGSVLNASEINENLMNQSVMVFSNSTARAAALTAPVEGMLTWLQDTNKYENYNGSAWVALGGGVLQVVSATKTDAFSSSSTSFTAVTGLSATITPSSATSKILVMVTLTGLINFTTQATYFRLMRGSTAIAIGDAAGSRTRASFQVGNLGSDHMAVGAMNNLDSPSTTSATTYSVELRVSGATGFVNRGVGDFDNTGYARTVSSITLMEVAG